MKSQWLFAVSLLITSGPVFSQVDTTFIYNTGRPYGTLDIRLAKSDSRYYYLKEGETFSFRENSPGVKSNTFKDMTSWDSSPYEEGNLREKAGEQDLFIMNYRLLKPGSYNESYERGFPLIILFHGAGERGNCWGGTCYHADENFNPNDNVPAAPADPDSELLNNDHNLLHGGKFYLDAISRAGNLLPDDPGLPQGAFPGFALFPQSMNGWSGDDAQNVIRIIRLLVNKYNIDEDRIYLTGLSNGGHGAFEALKRAPWLFASGILMSPIDDGFITNVKMESEVAHVPLWIAQGGEDTNPSPNETKAFVKKFRDAGAVIRYTEYPGIGHTVWNSVFKEPDYFSWLLDYSKAGVHVFAGSSVICDAAAGRMLELPPGFLAYQWQKGNQIISGASLATYKATTPGTYRGRFSRESAAPAEGQWNDWSDEIVLTSGSSPTAKINQVGTVLLRDLNNKNEAVLEAEGDFAHYYWYKDGTLIDFTGDQDDTLKSVVIKAGVCADGACSGNGVYTLVTANFDNCKSAPSEGKHVYFNNQAPSNIAAPTGLTASPASPSSVKLTWKDNATSELGYEVWRRRKISDTSFDPWVMSGLTGVNAASFTDTGLAPENTYQFKIRAVATNGRSGYIPSGENVLEVATVSDTQAPAAPPSLAFKRTGVEQVTLHWAPAIDETGVFNYLVVYDEDSVYTAAADTTIVIDGLSVNSIYHFRVAAIDGGGNVSAFSGEVEVNTALQDLFFTHNPGDFTSLDDIDFSRIEVSGLVSNFSLARKVQDDFFYFRFDGFIYIEAAGSYEFRTSSDDGSRLSMNGKIIVGNDGVHDLKTVSSQAVDLTAGAQRITVDFFDYSGTDSLLVEYKGPDTEGSWQRISDAALRSTESIEVVGTEGGAVEESSFSVFPNPASASDINVRFPTMDEQPVLISMFDLSGREMIRQEFTAFALRSGIKLEPRVTLTRGIYIIRISQGKFATRQKLIIRD